MSRSLGAESVAKKTDGLPRQTKEAVEAHQEHRPLRPFHLLFLKSFILLGTSTTILNRRTSNIDEETSLGLVLIDFGLTTKFTTLENEEVHDDF